jgi:hypothetical protein
MEEDDLSVALKSAVYSMVLRRCDVSFRWLGFALWVYGW